MSKADKRESKDNPNKKSGEISISHGVNRHGKGGKFSTVDPNIQHAMPKWSRITNAAGVDTGAIKNKKTGTILQRGKDGHWQTVSPNATIYTPAEIMAMEARRNAVPEPIVEVPVVATAS
jgi:hypothetical protein